MWSSKDNLTSNLSERVMQLREGHEAKPAIRLNELLFQKKLGSMFGYLEGHCAGKELERIT